MFARTVRMQLKPNSGEATAQPPSKHCSHHDQGRRAGQHAPTPGKAHGRQCLAICWCGMHEQGRTV
jgi:hypothetical protein